MAYSEKVLDHYENPRNVGTFDKGDDSVGTGMGGAPACGDVMKLQIRVNEAGIIEDARFKTYGCGSAIASSSLVTEWVKGKTLDRTNISRSSITAFIRHSKETNPCTDCNQFYPYYVMQYDHRPEHVKLFNISKHSTYTQDITVVKAEMDKCDLVCANCHMKHSKAQRRGEA